MKNSYDVIANKIREYWKNNFPQDVIVFFEQKYSYDTTWEVHQELVECESDTDYESVTFLNDFCEGQTQIRNIKIVPLSIVTQYYYDDVIKNENMKLHLASIYGEQLSTRVNKMFNYYIDGKNVSRETFMEYYRKVVLNNGK